jgi:hypothetical protein
MTHEDPASDIVQQEISKHYQCILKFWGKPDAAAEAYKGLGDLYVVDDRYSMVDGQPQPEFAKFLRDAMYFFADEKLNAS